MNTIVRALIFVLLTGPIASAQEQTGTPPPAASDAGRWRAVARATPLGSKLKVETSARQRYKGTLMEVTDEAIVIKRSTRLPEPPVMVRFDQVSRIEQDRGGMSVAQVMGVSAAAAGGAILTFFLIAFSLGD